VSDCYETPVPSEQKHNVKFCKKRKRKTDKDGTREKTDRREKRKEKDEG
jgi:hypothetical protein